MGCPACRDDRIIICVDCLFSGTNKCDTKHEILSLFKQLVYGLDSQSIPLFSPYKSLANRSGSERSPYGFKKNRTKSVVALMSTRLL